MGSIVGAAYASGCPLEKMEQVLSTTDWGDLFGEKVERQNINYRLKSARNRELYGDTKLAFDDGKFIIPQGVVGGQKIRLLLQDLFGNLPTPISYDSLPIPFRAVAADIETGKAYVPDSGDLATIVRASMSVPGAFTPVEIDGKVLVDGGIANNLPVDVAIKMGSDVLIVVDLQSSLAKSKDLTSPFSISGQMVGLLLAQNAQLSRQLVRPHDVVLEPVVDPYTVTDFDKAVDLTKIGEKSAESMIDSLRKLSISDDQYNLYKIKRERAKTNTDQIDFIRINNNSASSDNNIHDVMTFKEGEKFDAKKIEEDIERIYQMGLFKSVEYNLVSEGDKKGLELDIAGKEWLKQFVRFGFSLDDNLDGESGFRFGGAYRLSQVTTTESYLETQLQIGRTPGVAVELYSPFTDESDFFWNPKVYLGRTNLTITEDGDEIADYTRTEGVVSAALGKKITNMGEISAGISRGFGDLSREVGDPTLPEFGYDTGDLHVMLDLDKLDQPDFPTRGYRINTRYMASSEELGSSKEFQELSGGIGVPLTFGRNTFILRNSFATTFGERPVERLLSIGGFNNVSGYRANSLTASDYAIGQIIYMRQLNELANPFFNLALFAGVTYEATTINNSNPAFEDYDLINSGSAFIGADTPLFPLFLGFGMADTDDQSVYISFGRVGQIAR
jgi:NTE family protein